MMLEMGVIMVSSKFVNALKLRAKTWFSCYLSATQSIQMEADNIHHL